jgi:hypothetical protein
MITHTCMGCGLKTRYSYGRTCMACGLETRYSYGSWPDRHPQAAAAFAAPARIVGLSDGHSTAAMALTVPGTIIALAGIAMYPLVFVPLLVLLGVALLASACYQETRTPSKFAGRQGPSKGCGSFSPKGVESNTATKGLGHHHRITTALLPPGREPPKPKVDSWSST